jgi:hypothetical protein
MKLTSLSQEQIDQLIRSYDKFVSYIDDGVQYRQMCENNERIIKVLNYFGYDIDLNRIEPVIERKYKLDTRTSRDLNYLISEAKETIERVSKSEYIENKSEVIDRYSKIFVVELIPVQKTVGNCSWVTLEEMIVETIEVKL